VNTAVVPGETATGSIWTIDPAHSLVEFTAVSGTVMTEPNDLTAGEVAVSMDATSVTTGEPARDEHLRSSDFFGAADFPTITFRSTNTTPLGSNRFLVHGQLTMKGITRPVVLQATFNGAGKDPWGQTIASWSAVTEIEREYWGISFNTALETGGVLIGSRVRITLKIEAIQEA
jgi:polyisoprenoid-binding protein YceI